MNGVRSVSIKLYSAAARPPAHKPLAPDELFVRGQTVQRGNVRVRLPAVERRLFLILAARQHTITSTAELVELLCGDDPDGGPETAMNAVGVAMVGLRDAAAALGFRIDASGYRGFTLVPIPQRAQEVA